VNSRLTGFGMGASFQVRRPEKYGDKITAHRSWERPSDVHHEMR
jgi:hypothetical protein